MGPWIALAGTIVVQLLAGVAFLVNLKNQYESLARQAAEDRQATWSERKTAVERHDQMMAKYTQLESGLVALRELHATAAVERREGYRRLELLEGKVTENTEAIQRMRTKIHDISGVLQRVDPVWKPYES